MLTIPLRIVLLDPPAGVAFCLQKGKGGKAIEVDHQISQSGEDLTFSLSVNVKDGPPNSIPNFVGPYSQGTAEQRFFYLRCGPLAGQPDSPWGRRVKLHLSTIPWSLLWKVGRQEGSWLQASYYASAGDGGPSCARVEFADHWHFCRD